MFYSALTRVLASIAIGSTAGALCYFFLLHVGVGAGDFTWAYGAANDLLNGEDPYRHEPSRFWTPYPLPAALVAIPFLALTPELAAAVFFGLSTALMTYGLTTRGSFALFTLLSCPFWVSLQWAQWTPLIVAAAFFPILMFVVVTKPHVAAPVVAFHWSVPGIILTILLLAASLLIYPTWPIKWIYQLGEFQAFIPLLTVPGPLLLLALKRWRDPDAKFLLLASFFPQRWFYDALILWLIPKTRKEFLYTATFSWGAYLWRLIHMPDTNLERGLVSVLFFYLPMLVVILRRPK